MLFRNKGWWIFKGWKWVHSIFKSIFLSFKRKFDKVDNLNKRISKKRLWNKCLSLTKIPYRDKISKWNDSRHPDTIIWQSVRDWQKAYANYAPVVCYLYAWFWAGCLGMTGMSAFRFWYLCTCRAVPDNSGQPALGATQAGGWKCAVNSKRFE